jgi:hypothetical protein
MAPANGSHWIFTANPGSLLTVATRPIGLAEKAFKP